MPVLSGERRDRAGTGAAAAEELDDAGAAAHISTAKFVDDTPLYRQESQFARLRVSLGRATMADWMIQFGGVHVVPIACCTS